MDTIEREPARGDEHPNSAADPTLAAELTPTVERGRNLIVLMPPEAGYADPAVAALSGRDTGDGVRLLVLAGEAMLDSVGRAVVRSSADSARVHVAGTTGRAASLLVAGQVGTLVTTPETALDLITRSILSVPAVSAVFLAWPETWTDEAPLVSVMQDLPAESQRVLYTASPEVAARLGERYVRKGLTLGTPPIGHGGQQGQPKAAGRVTAVVTAADRIVTTTTQVIDTLDPTAGVVWTATASMATAMRAVLDHRAGGLPVVQGQIPKAPLIVAIELPRPEVLGQLAAVTQRLVVMTPVWGLPYLRQHAVGVDSLSVPGAAQATGRSLEADRGLIRGILDAWEPEHDRALYALGPLFEQYDPARVAAALYTLWSARPAPPAVEARSSTPARPQGRAPNANTAKIFVNAGKKDQATAADFVALLTKEIKVPRQDIGRIDLRETYSLIELPAADAQRIAGALTGKTVRKRDLVARLERPRG